MTREGYLSGSDHVLMEGIGAAEQGLESEVKGERWTLGGLAVDPQFQGMGIGGSLLEWGLNRADEKDLPVCCIASEEVGKG